MIEKGEEALDDSRETSSGVPSSSLSGNALKKGVGGKTCCENEVC